MARSRGNAAKAKSSTHAAQARNGGGANRRSPEQQQVRAVYAALAEGDYKALQDLAYQRFGFCSAELRRSVWLFLLGLSPKDAVDNGWRRHLAAVEADSKLAKTMQADVQRSVYSWDVHRDLRKTHRNQKRLSLSEVMHAILERHNKKLGYFQGFHDIALVFLEVGTPSQAFHMIERLALFHLSDQLCLPFDQGLLPLLGVLFFLLEYLDEPVARALREAECEEMHFAVSWVLTWFSHSLPRLHQQVMRLFDCLIASHPAMIFYFVAALLMQHRTAILETPRELPDMVGMIQQLPFDALDADDWAQRAQDLARRFTPEELVARLPDHCRLPPTSPIFHYPHPWMPSNGKVSDAGYRDPSTIAAQAPVYSYARGLGRLVGVNRGASSGNLRMTLTNPRLWALRLPAFLWTRWKAWLWRQVHNRLFRLIGISAGIGLPTAWALTSRAWGIGQ